MDDVRLLHRQLSNDKCYWVGLSNSEIDKDQRLFREQKERIHLWEEKFEKKLGGKARTKKSRADKKNAEVVDTNSEEDTGNKGSTGIGKRVKKVGEHEKKRKGAAIKGAEGPVKKKRKGATQEGSRSNGKTTARKPTTTTTKPAKKCTTAAMVASQLPPTTSFKSRATLSDVDESDDGDNPAPPVNGPQHASSIMSSATSTRTTSNTSTLSTAFTVPTSNGIAPSTSTMLTVNGSVSPTACTMPASNISTSSSTIPGSRSFPSNCSVDGNVSNSPLRGTGASSM
ncbi:hypothetical protein E1B28_008043 [Marasmius oreades]|uniref:Uncharacterized protein n=1 Tax=Marasmius oreades TaxID=181124 RepID=A0A9P7S3I9_9AGAR|nr:uncharacterized protein E1B28_008043 [Marasmius oreades]KAG7094447.1 hypothetical protein E1B28_008043 [Marasmius oreades]